MVCIYFLLTNYLQVQGGINMLGFNNETARKYSEKILASELAVELDPQLTLIAEKQARASHAGWIKGKVAQGYVYGPITNDDPVVGPLTNPLIVPYDQLPEETKKSNIANAVAILKILREKKVTLRR